MTRAMTTPQVIQQYHEELQKYHLLQRPEAIYNLDETGCSSEHHPPKVLHIIMKVLFILQPKPIEQTFQILIYDCLLN